MLQSPPPLFISWKHGLTVLATLLLSAFALAGPLDDKTPAYFVDRYGPAIASRPESNGHFVEPTRGSVSVKGPFSIRQFRDGDLRVETAFFLPSLKTAAVRLQLNRQWTNEQIQAALLAYGGEWKPQSKNGIVLFWTAPDGSRATHMLTWLDIQSKAVVDLLDATLAATDSKRRDIPKF